MWEGGGGQDGVERGEWDNCNSIINKYILKNTPKKKKMFYVAGNILNILQILFYLMLTAPLCGIRFYCFHFTD